MKIIFLDIDGILNSVDSAVAFYNRSRNVYPNEERLDPVSIGLLQRLCEDVKASIVISSTWRKGRSIQDFVDIFKLYGWNNFPCIGLTSCMRPGNCRGDEIQHWLDHNDVDSYVIFDDDSDMLESQLGNFVHVSNVNGLRSQHYCKALRILGSPDDKLEQQVNFVKAKQIMKTRPHPDYGDLFTIAEFKDLVEMTAITPDDGSGNWATETEVFDAYVFGDKKPEGATHVIWFNK